MDSFVTCFINTALYTPRHIVPASKRNVPHRISLRNYRWRSQQSLLPVRMSTRKDDRPTKEPQIHNEDTDLTLEEIEQVIRQFKESNLPHLYYRQGSTVIELKRKTNNEGPAQSFSFPVNNVPHPQTYNIYIPGAEVSNVSSTPTSSVESPPTSTQTGEQSQKSPISSTETNSKEADKETSPPNNSSEVAIFSKRVGRFRRGRSKKKPLVEVGDHIKLQQPLCVIEQLGLEHVYFAEVEGVVDKILVQDGDPVEYGQKLMTILTK